MSRFKFGGKLKIKTLQLHPYEFALINGSKRSGILINLTDETGKSAWGEIAPLPNWSKETLKESTTQLNQKQQDIITIEWNTETCFSELAKLELLPSVLFGLESALLSILNPLPAYSVPTSALLMGSPNEILEQAKLRHSERYHSAKLKVSNLSFEEAEFVIRKLKDLFRLRIDVNRAWKTSDSLHFFSRFPLDTFDYVEEPFQNPQDLAQFLHPLAVDESFPENLSLEQLESLPTLRALIYKPTMQGGISNCLSLHEWTLKKGLSFVLSSSFESDLGLAHIASMARRLSIETPIGIGTYHYLKNPICKEPLRFIDSLAYIPTCLIPQIEIYSS